MTAANSTELMPLSSNFTAGETNSTDSEPAFESYPAYDYEALFPELVRSWTARLLENWYPLFWDCVGLILSSLVIYLSLFNKKYINGDYKWFILNQAIASFICSFVGLSYIIVVAVGYGELKFFMTLSGSSSPLWMTIFLEFFTRTQNYGYYAQMTTLLITVLNRFVAIAFPTYYSTLMKPRLIVLYCILSFIVIIPRDDSFIVVLMKVSRILGLIITDIYELVPWMLSTFLSILIYCMLSKRQRNMTNVLDEETLKESHNVLRAVLIEVIFTFFNRIFGRIYDLGSRIAYPNLREVRNNWFVNALSQIAQITSPMTAAFSCLAILITMRPYREAVLSYLSPFKKCVNYLSNRVVSIKVGVQPANANRTPVIVVRSVPSANNGGVAVLA